MKKTIRNITVIILAIITVFSILLITTRGKAKEQYYPKASYVTEIDIKNNIVYVNDFTGNEWSFYGCEDWEVNDVLSMIMYTNKTASIFDDEIISVKYDGWLK